LFVASWTVSNSAKNPMKAAKLFQNYDETWRWCKISSPVFESVTLWSQMHSRKIGLDSTTAGRGHSHLTITSKAKAVCKTLSARQVQSCCCP